MLEDLGRIDSRQNDDQSIVRSNKLVAKDQDAGRENRSQG